MNAECRIEEDGTIFRISINYYYRDDDTLWTETLIVINNSCFNYSNGLVLDLEELIILRDMLAELVDGTIDETEKLDFCEPDLVIIFEPNKKSEKNVIYTNTDENNSLNEISISLLIYPFLDGRMTDQHYVFPLYMDAVLELLTYLTEKINELVI